jgi:hypothetical protein
MEAMIVDGRSKIDRRRGMGGDGTDKVKTDNRDPHFASNERRLKPPLPAIRLLDEFVR